MKTQILKRIYHTKPQVGSTTYANGNGNSGNYIVKGVTATQRDAIGREYYEIVLEPDAPDPTPRMIEETAIQESIT